MSHFSVVVCLGDEDGKLAKAAQAARGNFPDGKNIPAFNGPDLLRRVVSERLEAVMAPWDENREMEPYRDYERGEAADHWLYGSLKRTAEDLANGTGILPYEPDGIGWSASSSKDTPEVQRRKQQEDADALASLPSPVTWAALALLYNTRYDDSDDPMLVDDEGRAYTMSTYNPESKWDYWRIGGRWGGYFRYRAENAGEVVMPERGWDSPEEIRALHCDAGPKRALALDATREDAAAESRKAWDGYRALVDGKPDALPWRSFTAKIDAVPGYTIHQARAEYGAQPRVQAIRGTDFQRYDDAVAEFAVDADAYAKRGSDAAVPGYALVTLDGKWMAPGRMGWFGMSSDGEDERGAYHEGANAYIDALPDSAWLIALDCHI